MTFRERLAHYRSIPDKDRDAFHWLFVLFGWDEFR